MELNPCSILSLVCRGRSSIFGSRPQAKSDPRPLNDKGFQKQCIRRLIAYLADHNYNHAISEKLLSTPTSKEFLNIVQFLFHKVDTNIKFGPKVGPPDHSLPSGCNTDCGSRWPAGLAPRHGTGLPDGTTGRASHHVVVPF